MPQNALTLLEVLRDLLLGAAAGLAGGFVRWNNPERRRFGWCLAVDRRGKRTPVEG